MSRMLAVSLINIGDVIVIDGKTELVTKVLIFADQTGPIFLTKRLSDDEMRFINTYHYFKASDEIEVAYVG